MESQCPRISVVVPSYNRASFLPGCVRSLRECGVPDLEIVIVDDGSTDDTREVVASLQPGISYVYQTNKRLPGARNTGIRASTGKYVSYLDSDDYWLPGVPGRMADLLDRHPGLGFVFADARMGNPGQGYVSWYESAGREEFRSLPGVDVEPGLREPERLPFYRLMLKRNLIFTGSMMLRRNLVLKHGMFDERLTTGEDWEVWLRLLHQTRFACWNEPMAIYTKHDGAMTCDLEFMQKAWCEALLFHTAHATELAPVDRQLLKRVIQDHLFYYAYSAYDRGDLTTARRRFRDAITRGGFSARTAVYRCLTALPRPLPAMIRESKHLLSRRPAETR